MERASQITVTRPLSLLRRQLPRRGSLKNCLSIRERWRRRRWRGLVLLKLFVYINYYNIFLHINQRYIKLCIINLRFKSFFRKNFKKTIDKCVLLLYNILCCQVDLSAKIKYSSIAQLVEHSAVNRRVVGSSPTGGATWSRGQEVKTPPFHGGNRGSIPLGITILRQVLWLVAFY